MSEKLIVIGGTAAGLSAASKAKRVKPEMEIQVFEKSGYISYGACGLPYFVGGMIAEPDDLVSLTVEQMTNKRGVPTYIHAEVTDIDRDGKTVTVKNLDNGEETVHTYDKLVIAAGARPIRPDIPGVDAEGVLSANSRGWNQIKACSQGRVQRAGCDCRRRIHRTGSGRGNGIVRCRGSHL